MEITLTRFPVYRKNDAPFYVHSGEGFPDESPGETVNRYFPPVTKYQGEARSGALHRLLFAGLVKIVLNLDRQM